MARLPRKPKLLKYPKKPSAKSSTAVLERYLDRTKMVDKENTDRLKAYHKAVKDYEQDKKRHQELKHKIAGIGRAADNVHRRRATTRKRKAAPARKKRRTTSRKKATKRRR